MKEFRPNTMLLSRLLLAAVIVCGVWFSCTGSGSGSSSAGSQESSKAVDWEDSAFQRYLVLEHYYNYLEHDSLMLCGPDVMAYCREHEQWKWYYNAWETMIEDCVWEGDLETANQEAQLMYADAKERGDTIGQAWASYLLGISYGHQKYYDESVSCLRRGLEVCPKAPPSELLVNLYYRLCENLQNGKHYDEVVALLREWRLLLDKNPLPAEYNDTIAASNSWYFEYYTCAFDYELSQKHYARAEQLLDSLDYYIGFYNETDSINYANVFSSRFRLASEQGQNAKAFEWAEQYLTFSQTMEQSVRLDALLQYAQGLEGVGRYEEAIEYFRRFHELSDSMKLMENATQLNLLNKRLEIDELKGQQEREKMEHEHTRLQLMLIIGALVVLSLLVFIFFRHRAAKRLETAYYELEEKNKALVVANARAEESSRMKTDFIHQISHEIRTPLNILSGFTQIITTPGVKLDDATRAEANEKITENTDRITSLVNKMLELAETNSKVVIEMNDHVTLGEIVAGAVGESGIEDVAGVRFVLQLNADLATKEIVTNAQALQRALAQLLDNAGKFRKADAYNTVTFAVGIIASRLSFSVEDTGIGVPPEQSEHIFEEFVQLDKYKVGTGIGLTIARSLARRMGGDIVLDTAYTAGARFVLMLPLK